MEKPIWLRVGGTVGTEGKAVQGDGKEVSGTQDGHNIKKGSFGGWCCHNESSDK